MFADVHEVLLVKHNLASILREEIISGRLAPGERIVEGKWAAKLAVAQASIREALNILASEGFVQKGPGRSAQVTELTTEDVVQIYQVRGVLEGLAARLIVEKSLDLSPLDQAIADMRSAGEGGNVRKFFERDLLFHMGICELSGNRFLEQEVRRLLAPLFAFVVIRVHGEHDDPERWKSSFVKHRRVVEALRSGDARFAEEHVMCTTRGFFVDTYELMKGSDLEACSPPALQRT